MPRPRTIDPDGEVWRINARIPSKVGKALEKEAAKRGVTVGQIIRERLAKA